MQCKAEAYTVMTPIPGFIPRRLAIDTLDSPTEIVPPPTPPSALPAAVDQCPRGTISSRLSR
ncbi:hypothetical protein ACRE_042640 [Hapsidospora chrysogenum ATCC 11550]|uniref:Uncharacterized protein n=1 Tax=Hapsidospora chrysogenum (strain ATCC 11550 / CBS 779.69 / DSM 880 / IAM 14645 / JCM 23072 / IMI 49137) TaxID=857340 RepID=A0A086T6C4_HAPC1|nr:hypothetical protein ACRE_042640 [Hapsidospora chrysogenum ATCC 11550]